MLIKDQLEKGKIVLRDELMDVDCENNCENNCELIRVPAALVEIVSWGDMKESNGNETTLVYVRALDSTLPDSNPYDLAMLQEVPSPATEGLSASKVSIS